MAKSRIIPSSLRASVLARRANASLLRPPNLVGTLFRLQPKPFFAAPRLGLHPNWSHVLLPSFSFRAFSSPPASYSDSSRAAFTYNLSAAYSDKKHALDLAKNVFTYAASSRRGSPPIRALTAGERVKVRAASGQDSFFVAPVSGTDDIAFGVVDGVGGWEQSGIDPADFAHGLCGHMASAAEEENVADPLELLEIGHEMVLQDAEIGAGSSTACVASASKDGELRVANLGDSGFVHISPFRLNYVSPAQTHGFNTPYQVAKLPADMQRQYDLFGGAKPYLDHPADSALTRHNLSHGDILVFATDGVWDNLSAQDVLRLVSEHMSALGAWIRSDPSPSPSPDTSSPSPSPSGNTSLPSSSVSPSLHDIVNAARHGLPNSSGRKARAGDVGIPRKEKERTQIEGVPEKEKETTQIQGLSAILAAIITAEAKRASLDSKRDGPFAKEVQRLYPREQWRGGKQDDICVVVAVVLADGV